MGRRGSLGQPHGRPVYLEAVLFLLVNWTQTAQRRDELEGDERLERLLPDPAVGEHAVGHLDDVSLGEAVGHLRQAAHIQGARNDPSVALDDLFPQNCPVETGGKTQRARSAQRSQQASGQRPGKGASAGGSPYVPAIPMSRKPRTERLSSEWFPTVGQTGRCP